MIPQCWAQHTSDPQGTKCLLNSSSIAYCSRARVTFGLSRLNTHWKSPFKHKNIPLVNQDVPNIPDMSKAEKINQGSQTSQLKKDLTHAGKFLTSLASQVIQIEACMVDSEEVLAAERDRKQQFVQLQEDLQKCEKQRVLEAESFATSTEKLSETLRTRYQKKLDEYLSEAETTRQRAVVQEEQLKQTISSESSQVQWLKKKGEADHLDSNKKLKQAKESWQIKENTLNLTLKKLETELAKLSQRNDVVIKDLDENRIMLKGREMEVVRLTNTLQSLEAFSSKSSEQIIDVVAGLQQGLEKICNQCLESAEILPWNQFPDEIQRKGLPLGYSINSDASRQVFLAAFQYSICAAIVDNICNSLGLNVCQEIGRVSNALYLSNPPHEAVWRLMTANAILGDPDMLEASEKRLGEVADDVLIYWKIFHTESPRKEFRDKLTHFLVTVFKTWLDLMKMRNKFSVSMDGNRRFFDSDSEESIVVPGDFSQPSLRPVLCLFPVFLEDTFKDGTKQQTISRKGKMIYQNSHILLLALKEEQEMRSPRLSNKKNFDT